MTDSPLVRRIGFVSATAIVVSNMIGTGIFTIPAFLAGDLGTPALVIGIWLVGAAIAVIGALCYSELGVNFPRSGGEYIYLTEAWGPAWGFIDGWVTFFAGFSAPIAAAALAISAYLAYFFPQLGQEAAGAPALSLGFLTIQLGGVQLTACAVVVVFTFLNVFNVSRVAALQNALTGLKLLVLLAFLVLGFSVGNGSWDHFFQAAARSSSLPVGAQFAISLVFIYLGYSGWNAAVYVAEEIREPEKTLPRALLCGTLLVAVFFIALNCLYIYANPLEKMAGKLAVGATASAALFGPGAAEFFAAAMTASLPPSTPCASSDRASTTPWPSRVPPLRARRTPSGRVRGWRSSRRAGFFAACHLDRTFETLLREPVQRRSVPRCSIRRTAGNPSAGSASPLSPRSIYAMARNRAVPGHCGPNARWERPR